MIRSLAKLAARAAVEGLVSSATAKVGEVLGMRLSDRLTKLTTPAPPKKGRR